MRRPLRVCLTPGCPALVSAGYCDCCAPVHRQQQDHADRARRGSAGDRGYDAHHRRWRVLVLRRPGPAGEPPGLCVRCYHAGRTVIATVADHIVPLGYGGKRFALANGQGLCGPCNTRKAIEDEATYARVRRDAGEGVCHL